MKKDSLDRLNDGFTIVEVITALFVISIVLASAFSLSSQMIDNTTYSRNSLHALWVGQNRLAERAAGILERRGEERQGLSLYSWVATESHSPGSDTSKVEVEVFNEYDTTNPLVVVSEYFPVQK